MVKTLHQDLVAFSPLSLFPALVTLIILPHALALPRSSAPSMTQNANPMISSLLDPHVFTCAFRLDGYNFDLCSLTGRAITPTASAERRYREALSGSPAEMRSWSLSSSSPSESGAVAGGFGDAVGLLANALNMPRAKRETARKDLRLISANYPERLDGNLHGQPILSLDFSSKKLKRKIATRLTLICDPSTTIRGQVKYLLPESRTIEWRTRGACPVNYNAGPQPGSAVSGRKFRIAEDQEAQPIPVEEQPSDGDDSLLPHKPRWVNWRQWIAGLLLVSGACVICASILASSPRARFFVVEKGHAAFAAVKPIASRALIKIRPFARKLVSVLPTSLFYISPPFRQRDNRLVQWAEEDMGLQEDFMVNGTGSYSELDGEDWNDGQLDEYIPLTFSPRWGKKVRSYGSTPLREVFGRNGSYA